MHRQSKTRTICVGMRMEKLQKKDWKVNNKGLSLVELLVAITILSIAAGALLHAFVTATQFNARAKEKQRMTTAAQSVMEGLKAFDIEELCWQFNGKHPFLVYSAVGNQWEIAPVGGNVSIQPVGGEDIFVPQPTGYEFAMQDISYQGKMYDAKVSITPKDTGVPVYYTEEMNAYEDAVWRQAQDLDATVYSLVLQNVLDKLNEKDEFYEYELSHLDKDKIVVDRVITVSISEPSSGIQKVTVDCAYRYKVVDYPYYDAAEVEHIWNSETEDPFSPLSYDYEIYNNTNTAADGAALQNVYLYYFPSYASSIGGAPIKSDTINITNSTSRAENVYLIKQKKGGVSNLLTLENGYTPQVNGTGAVYLYHNLRTNLADSSATVGTVSISGFTGESTQILKTKMEHLMYSVTISVYDAGQAAAGFPDVPKLELDGSINGK